LQACRTAFPDGVVCRRLATNVTCGRHCYVRTLTAGSRSCRYHRRRSMADARRSDGWAATVNVGASAGDSENSGYEGERMPRIIVTSGGQTGSVVLSERINATDFESGHFRAQLVERLAWAIGDACSAEQDNQDDGRDSL